jgi:hypothetical protein
MYHLTIDAEDPKRMALLIAELLQGEVLPHPAVAPTSWIATTGLDAGFAVQVLPRGRVRTGGEAGDRWPVLLLDTPLGAREVQALEGVEVEPVREWLALSVRLPGERCILVRLGPARRRAPRRWFAWLRRAG